MGNSPLALGPERTSVLDGVGARKLSRAAELAVTRQEIQVLRGREALLSKLEMLNTLCERAGQAGATHWLEHQIGTPNERNKIPTLVLVGLRANTSVAEVTADDVRGAVILYEYRMLGRGTGVFAGDDSTGQRAVIAPKHLRAQVAEAVCHELVARGALAVMLTYEGTMGGTSAGENPDSPTAAWKMAMRGRSVPLYLTLDTSYETTLASLGKHTRRNLRYYRRRAECETGCEFVPLVEMTRREFIEINRASINPVPAALANWRYDAFSGSPGMLFAGVRASDGRWLSLIGGRRHRQITEIDWQINLDGLPRLSLSTVMRAYLLEHEVGLGTETLMFSGGTPHSMRHSFACVDVVDAMVLRQSAGARLLRALAPAVLPRRNFIAQALRDPQMCWVDG
jgi:hypothetical protein